ncbi:MAG TPA: hypothetical protein VF574_13305 [Allosphingosinicella sp.]|jgi:hypothetical protein
MPTPIPASAEEAALPPGLAERAAALAEPGEAVLWAGRGGRGSTFAALWPFPAVLLVLLALLVWLGLEGQAFVLDSGAGGSAEGAQVPAPFVVAPFAAACLWKILQFAHRVRSAPRTLWVLTPRRLIVRLGSRRADFPLARADRAVVSGTPGRSTMALEIRADGSRGSRSRPSLYGVVNADAAIEVMGRLGLPVSDERPAPDDLDDDPSALAPGESIRWSGRRGFGATGASRLLMLGVAAPLTLPFFWAVWFAWSKASGMDTLFAKLTAGGALLLVACIYLGPMAWLVLGRAPGFAGDLFVEIFGRLAVTDRRILFTAPLTGAVHRHISGDRITEALLIDVDERGRGYISLTLRGDEGEKEEIVDLYSVPDPENAIASIGPLIRRP